MSSPHHRATRRSDRRITETDRLRLKRDILFAIAVDERKSVNDEEVVATGEEFFTRGEFRVTCGCRVSKLKTGGRVVWFGVRFRGAALGPDFLTSDMLEVYRT